MNSFISADLTGRLVTGCLLRRQVLVWVSEHDSVQHPASWLLQLRPPVGRFYPVVGTGIGG